MTTAWRAAFLLVLVAVTGATVADAGFDTYRIGTDDVLAISVWDQKDLDQVVFVRPDGKISLLLLGEIDAGGRSIGELAARLSEMYSTTIKGARVTIGVREIRSRQIFFVGGVGKPGPLQLTQELTLLQALSLAGGLAPGANPESAFVLRGESRIPVDFVNLVQKGDVRDNLKLRPGDTVVVPLADVVYVQGEVKAPSAIRLTRDLTIVKAIVQAGGFSNLAASKRVSLIRAEGAKKMMMRINVDQMLSDPDSTVDVPLQPNDIILVPQRLF